MKSKFLMGLLGMHLMISSPISPSNFILCGNMEKHETKIQTNFERLDEHTQRLKKEKEIEILQKERIQEEKEFKRIQKIKEQKRKEAEERKKKQHKYNETYSKTLDVIVDVTYYFAEDSSLQGGLRDKKGKLLNNFDYPVCALPSDIPYGSKLVLNEPVVVDTNFNKSNELINVDTGNAIVWKGNNRMQIDVFVKNCDNLNWIINNLQNKTQVKAKLYYAK